MLQKKKEENDRQITKILIKNRIRKHRNDSDLYPDVSNIVVPYDVPNVLPILHTQINCIVSLRLSSSMEHIFHQTFQSGWFWFHSFKFALCVCSSYFYMCI